MYLVQDLSRDFSQPRAMPAILAIVAYGAVIMLFATGLRVANLAAPPRPATVVNVPVEVAPQPPEHAPPPTTTLDETANHIPVLAEPTIAIQHPIQSIDSPQPTVGTPSVDTQISLTQPRILKSFDPPYPMHSRIFGEQGVVQVKVNVDAHGRVVDAIVARTSGYARLDQAALNTVRTWRFAPAMRGTQPVATWVILPVRFELN